MSGWLCVVRIILLILTNLAAHGKHGLQNSSEMETVLGFRLALMKQGHF